MDGKLRGNEAEPASVDPAPVPGVDGDLDVVVVGAGFAGLYLLRQLRECGFSARVIEAADGVGGTWYWNRYPGARCDTPTTDYSYSFDPQLERDWTWSEKYATQPELLAYLEHVADRYGLRPAIQFSTRVTKAEWDERSKRWLVHTDRGDTVSCRFVVMATGCLSQPKAPDIAGTNEFAGEVYFTGRWPQEPVDFTGKRVAVIGTGSSGIQTVPEVARQAASLTVFQRTPSYTSPAVNGPQPAERVAAMAADRGAYREAARWSPGGICGELTTLRLADTTPEVRRQRFENAWASGDLFNLGWVFADEAVNPEANETVAEMIREKIRLTVADPVAAEDLTPRGYPYGAKRPCLDSGYYETFNQPHVRLVNLRRDPIVTITPAGVQTATEVIPVDAIVYAIGFDAMTGPLLAINIVGTDGQTLAGKWAAGPSTYLGLAVSGFPNLFMVTGPGSPSVLTNVVLSIEQHVDWIMDSLANLREGGFDRIEATAMAEEGWDRHVADCGALTLLPKANSWYLGVNVPGKPKVIAPYTGGVGAYRAICTEVIERGYFGFELSGPDKDQCNDGILRALQPDVAFVVDAVAEMSPPAIESMTVEAARDFAKGAIAERLPGPAVGEVVDGFMPTLGGDLPYRLYRPVTAGPHPAIVYFHGGGWVLGDLNADDPFCRDICVRTGCAVVSVNYRHAPEAPFPAAAADAFSALQWVASNPGELRVIPGRLAVFGWSAGGNLAAVACQQARDLGSPSIAGQVLVCPVTDGDLTRESYRANGEGYILSASTMKWFWDHYADEADRASPRAAPLHGDLRGLPPAVVVTAQFDPLRDEGDAYADALGAAGVPVEHIRARGHIHSSVTMVDVVRSGEPVRAEIARALREWLGLSTGS